MHTFRPHQNKALAYASPRSRIFLAMDMRTGKSSVAIRWAKRRRLRRVLCIAPLTTINPGWVEELKGEGVRRVHVLTEMKKKDRLRRTRKRGWHLINYEFVRANPQIVSKFNRDDDGIVLDESTKIRSAKAQITKVMLRNVDCEHRALLSGMPNPESTLDWFTQMVFMNGSFCDTDNYWAFRGRMFYQPFPGSWEWKPKKGATEKIKDEVHQHVFRMTAKQAGMGSRHIYEKRMVPMTRVQRQLQKEIVQEFAYQDQETKWAPVQQTWLARLAGGYSPDGTDLVSDLKLKEVLTILKNDLPKKSQLVVWARFRSEIKGLRQYLNSKGIETTTMTGKTDRIVRRIRMNAFQKGRYRVIVVQSKLGMYGLNLSAADTDLYYSNMWDNEVRSQCERRIEHMTKKRPLLHIDLMTKDSVDEEIVPRLRAKKLASNRFYLVLKGMLERWRRVYPLD